MQRTLVPPQPAKLLGKIVIASINRLGGGRRRDTENRRGGTGGRALPPDHITRDTQQCTPHPGCPDEFHDEGLWANEGEGFVTRGHDGEWDKPS